ncbi:MAG: outer membrane beta-barrel protein [Bauldia sp.]
MASTGNGNAAAKDSALKSATAVLAATGSLMLTWGAAPAMAQGRTAAAPTHDPFNSFSVGIGGGVDLFRAPITPSALAGDYSSFFFEADNRLQGVGGFGSVEAGKDFRFGSLVLGIYGEYNFGRKSDSATESWDYCPGSCVTMTVTPKLTLRNSYAVLGRLGVLSTPQTLIYGLFGYTWQNYVEEVTLWDSSSDVTTWRSEPGKIGGLTFGVGGEWLINQNWTLKGEYRFAKLSAPSGFGTSTPFFIGGSSFGGVDDHVLRGVISYKLPSP